MISARPLMSPEQERGQWRQGGLGGGCVLAEMLTGKVRSAASRFGTGDVRKSDRRGRRTRGNEVALRKYPPLHRERSAGAHARHGVAFALEAD